MNTCISIHSFMRIQIACKTTFKTSDVKVLLVSYSLLNIHIFVTLKLCSRWPDIPCKLNNVFIYVFESKICVCSLQISCKIKTTLVKKFKYVLTLCAGVLTVFPWRFNHGRGKTVPKFSLNLGRFRPR